MLMWNRMDYYYTPVAGIDQRGRVVFSIFDQR